MASEDLLRELNLVANPGYIHLAGNWELTDSNGQIIHLEPFTPSLGFPASQITSLQKITVRTESVLCIENLTSFHEFVRTKATDSAQHATICLMGNPSPAIRCLLSLISEEIPILLWSDMDYGGFNILSQLRRQVSPRIQPYLMDIATFDMHAHLSRPLTQSDARNLKRLLFNPILKDIYPVIEQLLKQGLKLEQEAIQI
jgi:DNA topoisomerase VI subunit A